tara:strand:- start:15964 stop:16341 length:378 start_codon:yes stop_codon:yes gene_type:complete
MKSRQLIGSHYRLPLVEEAVCLYNSWGEDFWALLDEYINVHDEDKYIFMSKNYILLGEVLEDTEGKYWDVAYASHRLPKKTIATFLELAPFRLDRVSFCRYHNIDKPKMYSWDKLTRIAKYYETT